jgi:hypothetical protein
MRDLELAGQLLEHACEALQNEMGEFAFKKFMDTWTPLADAGRVGDEDWSDRIKVLQDYKPGTYEWPAGKPWQEHAKDIQTAQRALQDRADFDPEVPGRAKEEERLLSTAKWLADKFEEQLQEAKESSPTLLEALAHQADLLRDFTEMWNIYQVAWEQRHKEAGEPDKEGLTLRSVRAADRVVRSLYEVVQQQKLDLEMPHQLLIVVPFMSGLYAAGFDTPTPYIVGPYWGHHQVWTWLGYAHEVGHHVYRNVKGLSDELKANVAMELWSQGEDYTIQRIWFNWLEEIFADLFGLLQIGPAFARTQQLMLPHLPFRVFRRMAEGSDLRHALLQTADETHPIPHLRVLLAIQALEKLDTSEADIEPLGEKWDRLFQGVDTSKVYTRIQGRSQELPTDDMEKVGDIVLDVILKTDLYALAKTSSPTEPRKLRDVLSEPLDERRRKIEAAGQAIRSGVPSDEFEMRHLLAATQEKLEDLSAEPSVAGVIKDLSTRVIETILSKEYRESPLQAL